MQILPPQTFPLRYNNDEKKTSHSQGLASKLHQRDIPPHALWLRYHNLKACKSMFIVKLQVIASLDRYRYCDIKSQATNTPLYYCLTLFPLRILD